MALETGVTYIEDLVDTNPVGATDYVDKGDDHIRNIKTAVQGSFPNLGAAAVTKTAAQINDLVEQTDPVLNGAVTGTAFLDEDDMATDSDTQLASQQSIKAYVDAKFTLASTVVTSSGTSVTISTTIPSWAKKLNVNLNDVSTTGSDPFLIQIGDSGGIETSNYDSSSHFATSINYSSVGFVIMALGAPSRSHYGNLTLTLQNLSTNRWVAQGEIGVAGQAVAFSSVGIKELSSTLTQLRITTTSGTDTFDAGSISVSYE